LQISEVMRACAFFAFAQTMVWFQLYSHYIWEWWQNRPFAAAIAFGIPASLGFWYGTRLAVDATNAAWTARLLGFGMSYLTFPVLTWWLLGESMFTTKTMICVMLSLTIVGIQLFWK